MTASTVPSASQKNSLEEKETVSVNTTPVKQPATLEKSSSSLKVTSIPPGSSLAKRASIFQQPASSTDSSTMGSTSSRRESRVPNPKFESLKKAVIIPVTPGTATQTLIQTTKNKGFIGSGTTGSTTTTSSSSTLAHRL